MAAMQQFEFRRQLRYPVGRSEWRECEAKVVYLYDGQSDPVWIEAVAYSDDARASWALEAIADEWIKERCEEDFAAFWLAELEPSSWAS